MATLAVAPLLLSSRSASASSGSTVAVLTRGSSDGEAVAATRIVATPSAGVGRPGRVPAGAAKAQAKPLSPVADWKTIPDGRLWSTRTPDAFWVGTSGPVVVRPPPGRRLRTVRV